MSWIPPALEPAAYVPETVTEDGNRELRQADTGFTGPDIEASTQRIAEQIFNLMSARVPGWHAHDGNADVWLIESFAQVAAEIRALASQVPEAIFTVFGTDVLGRPIRSPARAVARAKWTAADARGYRVVQGVQAMIQRTGDQWVAFEVTMPTEIPPGETSVENVEMTCTEDGAFANGLVGKAEPVDPLDWVDSIEITTPTELGDDGQSSEAYLQALSVLLRVLAFRPVLPGDFALLVLHSVAGVGRAIAMDGFGYDDDADPVPPVAEWTWGHARTVTLVVTDADGEPLPEAIKDQIRHEMETNREVNFRVFVIDPEYQTVDVDYVVTAFGEQNPEVVGEICEDAVRQLLLPAAWRLGITSPAIEAGEIIPPPGYDQQPGQQTIRRHTIVHRLGNCRGVDWVGQVLIDGAPDDVLLAGPTTLPRPGEITGEVRVPRGHSEVAPEVEEE